MSASISRAARVPVHKAATHAPLRPVQLVSAPRPSVSVKALPAQEVQTLMTLTGDNFHHFLQSTPVGHLTVVDFFTNWCAPCKCSSPVIERWSGQYDPSLVAFAKVDCAEEVNKKLAAELGVKALPTFLVYRGGQLVATSQGAKMTKLKDIIEQQVAAVTAQSN